MFEGVWKHAQKKTCFTASLKRAHQELGNETPLAIAVRLSHYPFLASLWFRSGLVWPERDNGVVGQLCQVGAHFEALNEAVFMVPSEFLGIFYHQNEAI